MPEIFFPIRYIGRAVTPFLSPAGPRPNELQPGCQQAAVVLRTLSIGVDWTTRPLRMF